MSVPRPRRRAPRGRDEVRAAVIDAAADLFARHGTASVSIRDIAAHARVNHGLVHRHFGSKEELVREVIGDLIAKIAGEIGARAADGRELPIATLLATGQSRYFRVLARALLDGVDVHTMQRSFPVVTALHSAAENARAHGSLPRDVDPKLAVAAAVSLGLGWLVFEPFVVAALGLDAEPEVLRRDMAETMLKLLRGPRAEARERA